MIIDKDYIKKNADVFEETENGYKYSRFVLEPLKRLRFKDIRDGIMRFTYNLSSAEDMAKQIVVASGWSEFFTEPIVWETENGIMYWKQDKTDLPIQYAFRIIKETVEVEDVILSGQD